MMMEKRYIEVIGALKCCMHSVADWYDVHRRSTARFADKELWIELHHQNVRKDNDDFDESFKKSYNAVYSIVKIIDNIYTHDFVTPETLDTVMLCTASLLLKALNSVSKYILVIPNIKLGEYEKYGYDKTQFKCAFHMCSECYDAVMELVDPDKWSVEKKEAAERFYTDQTYLKVFGIQLPYEVD